MFQKGIGEKGCQSKPFRHMVAGVTCVSYLKIKLCYF